MNKGAIVLIAVVLIIAFVVPLAIFSLITSDPPGGSGAWFVENDEPFVETGILALKFTLTETVEILTTTNEIQLRGRGVLSGEIPAFNSCSVDAQIGNDITVVGGSILLRFTSQGISGPSNSIQTYTGSAISIVSLPPGTYIYTINVQCTAPSWANVFFWSSGVLNRGTAGNVDVGFCNDWDGNGLWQCDGNFLLHVILDGEGEAPPDVPTNVTEDGVPSLIDTVTPPPPPLDPASATTMIIIGLIILIVGFAVIGLGKNTIFTIIGIIMIIIGLVILSFGSFIFFVPALAIRKGKTSNMLKGSLNLGKRWKQW